MTTQTLTLESAPLHTEKPKWAAETPAQVEAVCKRGADVLAFTELHTPVTGEVRDICKKHGYRLITSGHDTGVAVKDGLKITSDGSVRVAGRYRTHVTFEFEDGHVTVFGMHWATNRPNHQDDRKAQTAALIKAAEAAQKAGDYVFVMGDSNPTKGLTHKDGEPRATLNKAGFVLAYEQTSFPSGVGVNLIAALSDPNVKAEHVAIHPALGSDHRPVTVAYGITSESRPAAVQAATDALAEARAHLEGADKAGGPEQPVDAYWQARVDDALPRVQDAINALLRPDSTPATPTPAAQSVVDALAAVRTALTALPDNPRFQIALQHVQDAINDLYGIEG